MKYYERKGNLWLGLFFTIIAIGVGYIYWNSIKPQLNSLNKGIPVQATVVKIEFVMNGNSYTYTAQAEYKNPITKTRVRGTLGGYEEWMDVGEVVDAYYIASENLLLYKHAKLRLTNSYLLYTLIFGGAGLGLIIWRIYRRIRASRLTKMDQKIMAEIIDFNDHKNTITCKYVKDKKEWLFYRSHVDIKKLEKGISLGVAVPVYIKNTDYKVYHIAVEEI